MCNGFMVVEWFEHGHNQMGDSSQMAVISPVRQLATIYTVYILYICTVQYMYIVYGSDHHHG